MMRTLWLLVAAYSAAWCAEAEYAEIPAGSFEMGCHPAEECPERQEPHCVVFERPFLLQTTEVTVAQFRRFVEATGYRTVAEERQMPQNWAKPRGYPLLDEQPVLWVALPDAEAYCAWAGGRLPTEEEWAYAFRANETVQGHLWWNTDGRYVWYRENSDARPQPVGTKLPNAWGLYDMEGSAWEWSRNPGDEKYPGAIRGGSWVTCPGIEGKPTPEGASFSPFTRALSNGTAHIRDDIGFRCARDSE